jgi:hypothetical protein
LAAHSRFSERVVALRAEVREGRPDSRDALLEFLKEWLINRSPHHGCDAEGLALATETIYFNPQTLQPQ